MGRGAREEEEEGEEAEEAEAEAEAEEAEAEAEAEGGLQSSSEPSASRGAHVDDTALSRAPTAASEASKFSVSSPGRWKSARPSMRADSTANLCVRAWGEERATEGTGASSQGEKEGFAWQSS